MCQSALDSCPQLATMSERFPLTGESKSGQTILVANMRREPQGLTQARHREKARRDRHVRPFLPRDIEHSNARVSFVLIRMIKRRIGTTLQQ